jgi:uncharacterized membrane protein
VIEAGAIQSHGALVASSGRAGTFDGIFLTATLAVLTAGLFPAARAEESKAT